jgi:hypothetical protein
MQLKKSWVLFIRSGIRWLQKTCSPSSLIELNDLNMSLSIIWNTI